MILIPHVINFELCLSAAETCGRSDHSHVRLKGSLLVREKPNNNTQLVVPQILQRRLFDAAHSGPLAAHLGAQRMLLQLTEHYYWPGMKKDIDTWCLECQSCQQSKPAPSRAHGKLQKVITGAPMDMLAIDILSGLPTATDGNKHIMVCTDYFTKWSEAYALPDAEAHTCITVLYNNFFARFGLPRQLHTDQGRNFESKLFHELCVIAGITKSKTTPFHPRSDGQAERLNRTLLQMLRTTASQHAHNWPNYLPTLMSAYRMTVHSVTGVTPNEAMLGREVLTPATLIAQPPHETHKLTVPYVTSFRNTIREAHTRIRQSTASVAKTQKTYFDQHVKGSTFAVDQLVWLYWPRPLIRQSKRKLTQLWSGPWRIKQFHSKLVVVIRHEKTGKQQTVHVDRLAPCHTPTPTATLVHTDTPLTTTCSTQPCSARIEQTTTTHTAQNFDTPPFSQENRDSEAQDPYTQYTPSFDDLITPAHTTHKLRRSVRKRHPPSYLANDV